MARACQYVPVHLVLVLRLVLVFATASLPLSTTNKKCTDNNEYCLTHEECCSNSCLAFRQGYRCGYKSSYYDQQLVDRAWPQPFQINYKKTRLHYGKTTNHKLSSLFQGGHNENLPVVLIKRAATTESLPCKKVGEKCYRNEECCQNRCHGFLHQCVT